MIKHALIGGHQNVILPVFGIFLAVVINGCSGSERPVSDFNDLFARVQMSGIFADSKTFPDCVAKYDTLKIIDEYNSLVTKGKLNLHTFILHNFTLPPAPGNLFRFDSMQTVPAHIDSLWTVLTRHTGSEPKGSLLPLPYSYVVPGGRFREVYYWDSYFTMLGLKASGRRGMIRDMTENFSYQIHHYGFIPNGNRSYYLSRSQPPFFSLMVDLLAGMEDDSVYVEYLPAMETEYRFWMNGKDSVNAQHRSYRRVVYINDSLTMNRYWDDKARPRDESFREDSTLALTSGRDPADLYRNIRAACESGWDFSSRWLGNADDLGSIITTRILPVDLNCLMYHMEKTLAKACRLSGLDRKAGVYESLAEKRMQAIQHYFWNAGDGYFCDYNFTTGKISEVISLAGVYPLFFKVATREEAEESLNAIKNQLVYRYGAVTTIQSTGQQWDYPNGWPPLEYLTEEGLKNYGMQEEASLIRDHFRDYCLYYLATLHKFVEKYNVVEGLAGKGGEYPAQDGFGWTNGVMMMFMGPQYDTILIKDLAKISPEE